LGFLDGFLPLESVGALKWALKPKFLPMAFKSSFLTANIYL
jgi:hypothetical protein